MPNIRILSIHRVALSYKFLKFLSRIGEKLEMFELDSEFEDTQWLFKMMPSLKEFVFNIQYGSQDFKEVVMMCRN